MAEQLQAIRGMNDLLPDETPLWQYVEDVLRRVAINYGYEQIRFPILEQTALFARTIGEVTDIVEKEMYTFDDRNGDSLTLRPEGTAGCVRAAIEHGLLHNQIQRLWYIGPMFRYERPQKGRYRQFHQFGIEAFGLSGPDIDAEMILMTARIWRELNLQDKVVLHLNSLGTPADRAKYREVLVDYFKAHFDKLDADSQRRLTTNPMRILDSKNPDMQSLIKGAPQLSEFLSQAASEHFAKLCRLLDAAKIHYVVNPRLVRGLDYYTYTVFEWVTEQLGAQGTVCAGGRYDGLVEQLGGNATPAVGFALGLERLTLLVSQQEVTRENTPEVYLVAVGEIAENWSLGLAEQLRDALPELRLLTNCGGGSFKSQFKRADKSGAKWALIIGEDEAAAKKVTLKYLREEKPQQTFDVKELVEFLQQVS